MKRMRKQYRKTSLFVTQLRDRSSFHSNMRQSQRGEEKMRLNFQDPKSTGGKREKQVDMRGAAEVEVDIFQMNTVDTSKRVDLVVPATGPRDTKLIKFYNKDRSVFLDSYSEPRTNTSIIIEPNNDKPQHNLETHCQNSCPKTLSNQSNNFSFKNKISYRTKNKAASRNAKLNEASLSCLYTNATSLVNKVHELQIVTQSNNPDIVLISETWFSEVTVSQIVNYRLFYRNRRTWRRSLYLYQECLGVVRKFRGRISE